MFKIPRLVAKFPQVKAYSCNAQLFYKEKKKKRERERERENNLHQFH